MPKRKWYAEHIAEMMERMPAPGRKKKNYTGESAQDIAGSFGITIEHMSNMIEHAKKRGFEAYPKRREQCQHESK